MTLNRNVLIGIGVAVVAVVLGVLAWGSSAGDAAECPCDVCPCAADAGVEAADAGVAPTAEATTTTETTESTLVPAALSTETATTETTATETATSTTEATTTLLQPPLTEQQVFFIIPEKLPDESLVAFLFSLSYLLIT